MISLTVAPLIEDLFISLFYFSFFEINKVFNISFSFILLVLYLFYIYSIKEGYRVIRVTQRYLRSNFLSTLSLSHQMFLGDIRPIFS